MTQQQTSDWLNAGTVDDILHSAVRDDGRIREVLQKARELKGLDMADVAALCHIAAPEQIEELFATARRVKEEIYGHRMVLFAPLYISNVCGNECTYCAFRASNKALKRTALDMEGIKRDTAELVRQGHKRLLLVAGEGYSAANGGFRYVLDAIAAVYDVTDASGNIRRLNVNLAPFDVDEFRQLKQAGIGTYQLFQETYHRPTYAAVHTVGKKRDYDWRATALDRAMHAGIDDVGMGVLFGLHDWRFELLSLMQHIAHLEEVFGVGCHTISVPRIEPADHSDVSLAPPAPVSDLDFKKIIAILRLAVPYTGLILSTRESAAIRRECYALGVSQISAGSRTNPGGYSGEESAAGQFQLGDHRSLDEVVHELSTMGFIPSFCTACYRLGRTGQDFMDLAKPGLIKLKCDPNAVTTFQEYLIDYASESARCDGERAIDGELSGMSAKARKTSERMLARIRDGRRDVYC
ncbi:MAG: [FeFe] hydrogenase H-cluster radical SAM maturase HydG [Propionivibrio sp.]|jgi:2-iminoacetate synthase|uniref:[FeFe] hydrogenase H-cluster radical SAM maturase HydG n=1 Tax=Propionivibrio sp. TaxID=2212460 RepID=UPI001B4265BC|nr:[FeFe] hydrogenase H-cluster radical SAM maturase HydG [Propionivibrio sp.]MBP7202204.1 [FeFe] hydrogenase H-cluster radical SAM maturase HydG [Propionivibrio sp.]